VLVAATGTRVQQMAMVGCTTSISVSLRCHRLVSAFGPTVFVAVQAINVDAVGRIRLQHLIDHLACIVAEVDAVLDGSVHHAMFGIDVHSFLNPERANTTQHRIQNYTCKSHHYIGMSIKTARESERERERRERERERARESDTAS
jgi:hypothetical protein